MSKPDELEDYRKATPEEELRITKAAGLVTTSRLEWELAERSFRDAGDKVRMAREAFVKMCLELGVDHKDAAAFKNVGDVCYIKKAGAKRGVVPPNAEPPPPGVVPPNVEVTITR